MSAVFFALLMSFLIGITLFILLYNEKDFQIGNASYNDFLNKIIISVLAVIVLYFIFLGLFSIL